MLPKGKDDLIRRTSGSESSQPFLSTSDSVHYSEKRQSLSAKFYGESESQLYEQDENEIWKLHQLQR